MHGMKCFTTKNFQWPEMQCAFVYQLICKAKPLIHYEAIPFSHGGLAKQSLYEIKIKPGQTPLVPAQSFREAVLSTVPTVNLHLLPYFHITRYWIEYQSYNINIYYNKRIDMYYIHMFYYKHISSHKLSKDK